MAEYELIGKKLGHSFSKSIHEALGSYTYALRELPDETAVAAYLAARTFKGCNVTIPYKQFVMAHCDEIDERARQIGAVNTIVNRGGRLLGYNTDYDGLQYTLRRKNIKVKGKCVLLLGSGGTAKTAAAVAAQGGAAQVLTASRTPKAGQLTYQQAMAKKEVQLVINVSPTGMYPHNGGLLVNLAAWPRLEAVVDVVYNPLKTALLLQAESLGLPAAGGLPMLVEQAVAAAQLFTGRAFGRATTEQILKQEYIRLSNLILIGMPSSGKSKLGRAAARKLGKPFLDLDRAVQQKAGLSIPAIFKQQGEAGFRQLETQVLAEETKLPGRVLATGGGVVTQPQNLPLLRQNGVVIFLDRKLEKLEMGGNRPLSKNKEALAQMQAARTPLYLAAADAVVKNDGSFIRVMHRIIESYYANISP